MSQVASTLKFQIRAASFFKEIAALSKVISTNPIVPILSNFLLEISEKSLTIVASDLHTSITATLPVQAEGRGKIAVPATMLVETLRNLPDQPLELEINRSNYTLTIVAANGRYKVACENADNFPEVPPREEAKACTIPVERLKPAIKQTLFAVSKEGIRPSLGGINIAVEQDSITFAATDGYRLARHVCHTVPVSTRFNVTLPARSLHLLSQLAFGDEEGPLHMSIGRKNAFFWTDSLQVAIGLIDEPYPDYENIIPAASPYSMSLSNKALQDALKVIYHYANKTTRQIRVKLSPDCLEIYAEDLQFSNEAQVRVTGIYQGEALTIGLNSGMLLEMLRNLPEGEVVLHFTSPQHPVTLRPALMEGDCDVLMLIMPIALKGSPAA